MSIKKILYIVIGCISVVLGAIGAVIPFYPPFLFCFLQPFALREVPRD